MTGQAPKETSGACKSIMAVGGFGVGTNATSSARAEYGSRVGAAERLDACQRQSRWLGLPIAVIYKFAEDPGPYRAVLVTYYAFVSVFPLLLVFTSAVAFFVQSAAHPRRTLISSATRPAPLTR